MLTSPIVGLSYAQWLLLLSNGAWSDTTVVVLSREMMWWRYGMFNSSNSSGSENFETFLLFLPNKAPVTEQSLPLYRNKGSKHNQQCLIWDENHWRLNGTWRSFIITHLAKSMTMLKKKMEFKTMFFILKCVFHSGLIESLLFPNSSASLSAVSCPIYSEGNVLDSTSSHYLGTKWQSRDQRPFMQLLSARRRRENHSSLMRFIFNHLYMTHKNASAESFQEFDLLVATGNCPARVSMCELVF